MNVKKITVGESGQINVTDSGEYIDYSKVSGANIQVKDYVNYPCDYTNVPTIDPKTGDGSVATSEQNGWRCMANYIDDDKNKIVKLITAGVPETYKLSPETDFSSENLYGPMKIEIPGRQYNNAYELKNLGEYAKEKYYNDKFASSYSTFSVSDAALLYPVTGCSTDLEMVGAYYWVNGYDPQDGYPGLGYMLPNSVPLYNIKSISEERSCGIRPTVILRNDLYIYKIWDEKNQRFCWEFEN